MGRRFATRADLDAIVAMGRRFLAASSYRAHVAENPEQMRILAAMLIDGHESVIIVAEDASGLVGMIGLLLYDHPMSGARVCGELFWWVEPEKRGIGVRLLKDAERWAKAHGAFALAMIAPTPEVETLYERLGYQAVERAYQRAL